MGALMKKTALIVAAAAALTAVAATVPARAYEFTVTGDLLSDARRAADYAADAYYSGERCSYGCTVVIHHGWHGHYYHHRYYYHRRYNY
jgi:phospholipase/lecithinase/hemolysin